MFLFSVALFAVVQVASVFAQTDGFDAMSSPTAQSSFAVGDTLPIVWVPGNSNGTITIELIGGASPSLLNPVAVVACKFDNEK